MTRIGMIGLSEGNGHPFSFSAIVNGYNRAAFARAGWPVILNYLEAQPPENFGFGDTRVTHAWTQDREVTEKLCAACLIGTAVREPSQMLDEVDAVIVARDDWESHVGLAMPFLRAGLPVFVDKPLSLIPEELAGFEPFLANGTLMSTSGLRYARELDALREGMDGLGAMRLVAATVVNGVDKYGVHMLDAIDSLGLGSAVSVTRLAAAHQAFALTLESGVLVNLNCLGPVGKTFHISLFAEKGHMHADLNDNFTAFRRTIGHFLDMVATRRPPITPDKVLRIMATIRIAAALAPGETAELNHA